MTAKGAVPKRRKPIRTDVDLLAPSPVDHIERPNQVKLTLSNEEKQCLDVLRLAKGLTTSDFLRQQIREAYHAHQALLAQRPNGTAAHAKPR